MLFGRKHVRVDVMHLGHKGRDAEGRIDKSRSEGEGRLSKQMIFSMNKGSHARGILCSKPHLMSGMVWGQPEVSVLGIFDFRSHGAGMDDFLHLTYGFPSC